MELVRYLTIGSINRYRLRGRTATDPTVNPLIGSLLFGKPRTIYEYTRILLRVKPFVKNILAIFHRSVEAVEICSTGSCRPRAGHRQLAIVSRRITSKIQHFAEIRNYTRALYLLPSGDIFRQQASVTTYSLDREGQW